MKVDYNQQFNELYIVGAGADRMFHATAKIHGSEPEPYEDDAGKGQAFTIGPVWYLLHCIDGVYHLTVTRVD